MLGLRMVVLAVVPLQFGRAQDPGGALGGIYL
jgi:hypothetical protein